jgi:hypothetical protein
MTPTLEKFAADLYQERISRTSLFWLRLFVQQAQDGVLRSDVWVESGLREGVAIPGLDATDLAPRLALLTDYDLFQATRLKDQQSFAGPELATLDWNRKYNLSLLVDLSDEGSLADWVEGLWAKMGAVSPQDEALEKLLAERSPLWGVGLPDSSYLL